MSFTVEQISLSTAEDELNYFSGFVKPEAPALTGSSMPSGTYRVLDGSLYLVLATAPSPQELRPSEGRKWCNQASCRASNIG